MDGSAGTESQNRISVKSHSSVGRTVGALLMTSEQAGTIPPCARRVGIVLVCLCIAMLSAGPAVGEITDAASYDAWQWNGFSRSSWVAMVSVGDSPAVEYSTAGAGQTAYLSLGGNDGSSLSGVVYFDEVQGATHTYWYILDAALSISRVGSSTPLSTVYTGYDGSYTFSGLAAGDYTVTLLTPSSKPEQPVVGTLADGNGNNVVTGTGTVSGQDSITAIHLVDGYTGSNYNFPQGAYPYGLLSKRHFIVPEPGSLVLLVVAGLFLGCLRHRRLRCRD
jgi:hypothetical protein